MTIPVYTNDGILPPFLGPSPAHDSGLMSPYKVSVLEVIDHFAVTRERISILKGWLSYREALRGAGFAQGFQWLDGSFVEDKTPNDLDLVTCLYNGPPSFPNIETAWQVVATNQHLFERNAIKATYSLDAFFIDLLDPPEFVIEVARYWLGLFSHQRITMIWKGMLQVRLEDAGDAEALVLLMEREEALPPPQPVPAINLSLFESGGLIDAS